MFITPILPVSGYKCSGCSVFRSCSGWSRACAAVLWFWGAV